MSTGKVTPESNPNPCSNMEELMHALLLGTLLKDEKITLSAHIEACDKCRERFLILST